MPILRTLKSLLGRDDRADAGQDVTVTVEHDPDNEAAVKGVDVDESGDDGESAADEESTVDDASADEDGSDAAEATADQAEAFEEAYESEDEDLGAAGESVDVLNGIGPAYADRLADAGVETVADLADADAGDLAAETDIAEGRLQGWIGQATDY